MTIFLNRLWYEGQARWALLLLWPLSCLYRLICWLRRLRYRFLYRQPDCAVPIIVIGNLTVGGTGKTPLTMALLEVLLKHGLKPGVIARGYQSQAEYASEPVLIASHHTAAEVGDEALLIFKTMQVPVAVNHQRVQAVAALLAQHPDLDMILSDDGLQHLKLPRALEIVVVDGERQCGNGHLLPAGPLREPRSRLQQVDFVVQSGIDFKLVPQELHALQAGHSPQSLNFLTGKTIHAVAGIGHPARFFALLKKLGAEIIPHIFPDHHAFAQLDFKDFQESLIVMTAKDAIKCEGFHLPQAYYLNTYVKLDAVFEDAFWQKLRYIVPREVNDGDSVHE